MSPLRRDGSEGMPESITWPDGLREEGDESVYFQSRRSGYVRRGRVDSAQAQPGQGRVSADPGDATPKPPTLISS